MHSTVLHVKGLISMLYSHNLAIAPPPECDLNLKFEEGARNTFLSAEEGVFYG